MANNTLTNVTIFTDISMKNGDVAFAYYIRSDYHAYKNTGYFAEKIMETQKAEMYALGVAIKKALELHENINLNKIYLYCDNQFCIDLLKTYAATKQVKITDKTHDFVRPLYSFLRTIKYPLVPRK